MLYILSTFQLFVQCAVSKDDLRCNLSRHAASSGALEMRWKGPPPRDLQILIAFRNKSYYWPNKLNYFYFYLRRRTAERFSVPRSLLCSFVSSLLSFLFRSRSRTVSRNLATFREVIFMAFTRISRQYWI